MCNKKVNRWFWRCRDCLTVVAVEAELSVNWNNTTHRAEHPACGLCGGEMKSMGRVQRDRLVNDTTACACDGRCTGATGPNCDCRCGGENHGTGRVVAVTIDAGKVPVVRVPDSEKSRRVAAEWRAALEPLRAERNAIAERRAAGWIPRDQYDRWNSLCRAINHAMTLRTHAGRMARLARVAASVGLDIHGRY